MMTRLRIAAEVASVVLAIGIFVASCGVIKGAGADIAELGPCDGYAWLVGGDCGEVFLCDLGSAYYRAKPASMHTTTPELCWIDDDPNELAAALGEDFAGATCAPTPRGGALGWPCIYGCEPHHKDSNAYQGSYCP